MNGAIIGLGHGERVILKAFQIENIKLLGVYSKNLKKAQEFSKKNNLKRIYESVDDLINDKEIHLIAIAVPAYYQIGIIKKCLTQKKYIFAEKPITTNFNNLRKIILQIKQNNKQFIVDYIFQKHHAFKKFKSLLPKSNLHNTKIIVNFKTQSFVNKYKIENWKNKSYLGGGLINLYLPHILEYLIFFFGSISEHKIKKKNKNFYIINYSFKNGVFATININSNDVKREHSIEYQNNEIKLILKNNSKDYAKGFKITKLNKLNNQKKTIKYNNAINKFRTDGRIFLTSKLLKLFSKKFIKKEHIKKISEYFYIESILNKTRKNL